MNEGGHIRASAAFDINKHIVPFTGVAGCISSYQILILFDRAKPVFPLISSGSSSFKVSSMIYWVSNPSLGPEIKTNAIIVAKNIINIINKYISNTPWSI
jgi:hypothetical protein